MIDLHLHSTYSDGTCSPAELVSMGARKGLIAISITDHDTIEGVGEAVEAGRRSGIDVISGIELSVVLGDCSLHLLGYGFDWQNNILIDKLGVLQQARHERNMRILGKLEKSGVRITEEELAEISGGGQSGRPHIARLLVEKGVVGSMDHAFETYLAKDKPAYVKRFVYSAQEAISVLHRVGGIAVMAHPVQLGYSLDRIPDIVTRLKEYGLDGIETYYPTQKGRIRKKLKEIARECDLLETGGSDYHGDIRPGTTMAGGIRFSVPVDVYECLKKRIIQLK